MFICKGQVHVVGEISLRSSHLYQNLRFVPLRCSPKQNNHHSLSVLVFVFFFFMFAQILNFFLTLASCHNTNAIGLKSELQFASSVRKMSFDRVFAVVVDVDDEGVYLRTHHNKQSRVNVSVSYFFLLPTTLKQLIPSDQSRNVSIARKRDQKG